MANRTVNNDQLITAAKFQDPPQLQTANAQRLLIMGGIALILAGMILGDIFAIFILHPNARGIGQQLLAASNAVAAHNRSAVIDSFRDIGTRLENRGTQVDAHAHIIAFGYMAFVLALIQPYVALAAKRKRQLAILFLLGAALLPVGVFLIHYIGVAYSPFQFIGWASMVADFGGLLVIVAFAGQLIGIGKHLQAQAPPVEILPAERSWASRTLLCGGTFLILAGFLLGAYYAAFDLYLQEAQEVSLLTRVLDDAAAGAASTSDSLNQYGLLQADKAVKVAAHAHFIEFGVLAFLLSWAQPYVFLSECWKKRWVALLLLGSAVLPVFVVLELRWGLLAGGIADLGGALVILALLAMLVGMLRYTGKLDAQAEPAP